MLTDTTIQVGENIIHNQRGCPQGSCLSPDLWSIGIADLCRELEDIRTRGKPNKSRALAFADDILCFCWDKNQLTSAWRIIKRWSEKNGVPLNLNKCYVMELRVDQRTPRSDYSPLIDIPNLAD